MKGKLLQRKMGANREKAHNGCYSHPFTCCVHSWVILCCCQILKGNPKKELNIILSYSNHLLSTYSGSAPAIQR